MVAQVAAAGDWPERQETIKPRDVFDLGDLPGYRLDLLAWLRSARDREGPVFPPAEMPSPRVDRGTVILSGGGGVQTPTWRRYVKAAGGKDALMVSIPSADEIDPEDEPDSYSADQLRSFGCSNIVVLHTYDPERADNDQRMLEVLEKATGVWIDGGRTYRIMDALQHTRTHELIRKVLERGGVVGGSSAGCQVIGDFLVRGNPRTNKQLVFDGYTRGLGILEGVVVDAHFRQRKREDGFVELLKRYPQMFGIGIDGDSAIVINGSTAEVLGLEAASFYDPKRPDNPVILTEGQRYDLAKRRPLR